MANPTHRGACFCGAITLEVSGEPQTMAYCHCHSCRSWSGSPVSAITLWPAEAVRVTAGAQHLATFQKTALTERQFCALCGGHLMTVHPILGVIGVLAGALPTLAFTPSLHVNYAETVLPMPDGLPKLKDFPGEFYGSDELVPE